jgi:SAM-dependent methyltransferase
VTRKGRGARMKEGDNAAESVLWGSESPPDLDRVFQDCLGYAATPGWSLIRRSVLSAFGRFDGLQTIELGCGLGKVSLLFSLLGAKATLLDYSERQLEAAGCVHASFDAHPSLVQSDLLDLPQSVEGAFDVSMSFGTAEHFGGEERQRVFDAHARVLRPGGLAFVWVPNRLGVLFHLGRATRQLLRRSTSPADEVSFSRAELAGRAAAAGFCEFQIHGAQLLRNDFVHHIIDIPRLLGVAGPSLEDGASASRALVARMEGNRKRIWPWNDALSYPLILVGTRG